MPMWTSWSRSSERTGNSLLNAFRKNGVPYAEIVRDVADKLDVEHTQRQTVERIELAILDQAPRAER